MKYFYDYKRVLSQRIYKILCNDFVVTKKKKKMKNYRAISVLFRTMMKIIRKNRITELFINVIYLIII